LSINAPTDLSIDKILKQILDFEEIRSINDIVVEDIRTKSGRDLRNAI
jgi:hypothetical protein